MKKDDKMVTRVQKESGVEVVSGEKSGMFEQGKGWVRIAFAVETKVLKEGLGKIGKALEFEK